MELPHLYEALSPTVYEYGIIIATIYIVFAIFSLPIHFVLRTSLAQTYQSCCAAAH